MEQGILMRLNDVNLKLLQAITRAILQGYGQVVNVRILDRPNQFRIIICRQGMQRKKRTEQLRLGNGKVMELKLIKHDEAL